MSLEESNIDYESKKLKKLSEKENEKIEEEIYNKKYLNLNLQDLYQNFMQTMIDILDDFMKKKPLLEIFTKEDRLFYLGILVMFVSFCLYLIDITK